MVSTRKGSLYITSSRNRIVVAWFQIGIDVVVARVSPSHLDLGDRVLGHRRPQPVLVARHPGPEQLCERQLESCDEEVEVGDRAA
jgi:hypothetical protein